MTDDILLIETDQRVRTLTLNRPESRNALSAALRDRLFGILAQAEVDDDVDVVILTGADPVFCAGLDLKELGGQSTLPDISPQSNEIRGVDVNAQPIFDDGGLLGLLET
jgi:enoyl-CoA hydratase